MQCPRQAIAPDESRSGDPRMTGMTLAGDLGVIGETISHYRILSKLGEGGMGVVYRAEDLTLGRTVALKFLPPDSVASAEDRARLVHEARAAAALLHPNICPIHEIAESEGRTFIAMAHIDGQSLKDRIAPWQ